MHLVIETRRPSVASGHCTGQLSEAEMTHIPASLTRVLKPRGESLPQGPQWCWQDVSPGFFLGSSPPRLRALTTEPFLPRKYGYQHLTPPSWVAHGTHQRGHQCRGRLRPQWRPPGHRCCCWPGTHTRPNLPLTSGAALGGSRGPGGAEMEGVEGLRGHRLAQASSIRLAEATLCLAPAGGRTSS